MNERNAMEHNHPGTVTAAPPAPAAPAATAALDPASLQQELAARQDRYRHLAADFDNFRKRTRRDAARDAAAEKEAFILELLPVLDNLERALAPARSTSAAQLRHGVELTRQQLVQLLHRHGIAALDDVGQAFDPHRHEAVYLRRDSSQPDGVILEVVQRGYGRGDQVFRPAKVVVNDLGDAPGAPHAR